MPVWLVILLLGEVIQVLGPVPGGMLECLRLADDRTQIAGITEAPIEDVTLDCVRGVRPPRVGSRR